MPSPEPALPRFFAPTAAVTVTAGISYYHRPCPHSSSSEPWFLCVLLECDSAVSSEPQISPVVPCFHFHQLRLTPVSVQTIAMVLTKGGSHLRPRVRFSTLEREEQAPVPAPVPDPVLALVPEAVPEEPQGFRKYQTRMGPRAPSPVPQRRSRRGRPSKRARTSGLDESSSSRPQPTQREMVRILARDATVGPIMFRRQLPPQMLLVDHLFRTSLFPLQHYLQRRGAILEALYRISKG